MAKELAIRYDYESSAESPESHSIWKKMLWENDGRVLVQSGSLLYVISAVYDSGKYTCHTIIELRSRISKFFNYFMGNYSGA